ncbi:MAG: hypothetical protein A3J54_03275 [Candidatus Ryanbacteria bacterium RIFCSPHIGHO2_02_FULL_45_13b]|uniref:Rod shape-determining protein MreD n=1 Tax=Candidatus Ryanbacteria bacterium RIFCSPHIGHO2_02_FULL_45_13b TaxID=1802117 RepID=A0A1G2G490_9BACT|nr:MAG: hypothetical protein A3J54_03275 [Candidatus Ryanbacteria bacterium RIFCSPHIGHO2_02_FULL_45_13b]
MNKTWQNTLAASGSFGLLLLQISAATGTMNFLFFPVVSFYLATYMTAPLAFMVGVFMGSILDSVSLVSSAFYAFVFGISMGGVSLCMSVIDERNAFARGFVTCCFLLLYSIVLGLLFFFLEKDPRIFILQAHDTLLGSLILFIIIITNPRLQKLFRHI